MDVRRLAAFARGQHGLVTLSQAAACGLGERALERRVTSGALERLYRGVYRMAGAPLSLPQVMLAACLTAGPGAMTSHRAAAHVLGLSVPPILELVVPPDRFVRVRGVLIHRVAGLPRPVVRDGLPVTPPARTLLDVCGVAPDLAEDLVIEALVRRIVTVRGLQAELRRSGQRGRPGTALFRELVAEIDPHAPESVLEGRMARLLRAQRLPRPRAQFGALPGVRVDFAYPEFRLAIEVDGFGPHTSRAAFQRDRSRQNRLVAAGWRVLRYTWRDVVHRGPSVAAEVRTVLRSRAAA